jgi:hypothetical protein
MNDNRQSAAPWLKTISWVQAIAIAALAFVVSRGDDAPPSPPPPSAGPSPAAPADAGPSSSSVAAPPPAADAPARDVAAAAAATPAGAKSPDGTILFGRFVDASGEPVREGYAWLTRDGEQKEVASLSAQSGSAFAVAGLPPGTLHVRTRADGYRELRDDIEIPAGAARLRHDLVLQKSWTLLVKILTPEGKPLHVAIQELIKTRPQLWQVQVGALATTWQPGGDFPPTDLREAEYGVGRWLAANGPFSDRSKLAKEYAGTLDLAEPQPLWVSAVLRHRLLATARVEPGQAEVTLTVAIDQLLQSLGVIRLRVVDGKGAPVAGARVGFSDVQSGGAGDVTGAEGRVEVRDLRPGLLRM